MWQYIQTDELYHYGVPGMKWGVIRYKNNNQYKKDKRIYKGLKKEAIENTRWARAYNRKYWLKNKELEVSKKIDSILDSNTSNRTKRIKKQIKGLKQKEFVNDINKRSLEDLKAHTNKMIEKYGNKSIRDVKTKIIHGKEYIRYIMPNDIYSYSFHKTKHIDRNGKIQYRYTPIKIETD